MSELRFLVPATIGEFEVLRDLGAFQGDASRLVTVMDGPDSLGRPEVHEQLLARLPVFRPGEDHTVVVLAFSSYHVAQPLSGHLPPAGKVRLQAGDCDAVYPLSRHAAEILKGRYDGQVHWAEPVFEDAITKHVSALEAQSSHEGARALVEALVENVRDFDSGRLLEYLEMGLEPVRSLLVSILKHTRYKAMVAEPVSGLRDLGTLLKDAAQGTDSQKAALTGLAEWLRSKHETSTGFRSVYQDVRLMRVLGEVTRAWNLPLPAAGLGLFLHWRELALRARGLDLKALESDCRELAGYVDGSLIADALWLLGYSAGFEAISSGYYDRLEDKHPFKTGRTSGKKVALLKLALPETAPADEGTATLSSAEKEESGPGVNNEPTEESKSEASDGIGEGDPPEVTSPEVGEGGAAPTPDDRESGEAPGDISGGEEPALQEASSVTETESAGEDTPPVTDPISTPDGTGDSDPGAEVQPDVMGTGSEVGAAEPSPPAQAPSSGTQDPVGTGAKAPRAKKPKSTGKKAAEPELPLDGSGK